jgi:uncharacterized membrane protein
MTAIIVIVGIAAAVMFYCMVALAVRQGKALLEGNQDEFDRLSTPYDIAALMALRDFKVKEEVFELTWNELKESRPDALPYDVYLYFKNGRKW